MTAVADQVHRCRGADADEDGICMACGRDVIGVLSTRLELADAVIEAAENRHQWQLHFPPFPPGGSVDPIESRTCSCGVRNCGERIALDAVAAADPEGTPS